MYKTCTRCENDVLLEDFSWANKAKGKRSAWCRPCYKEYDKERWSTDERKTIKKIQQAAIRKRNQQFLWDYLKENPCPCGETDPVVLEFDHRTSEGKIGNLSEMASNMKSIQNLRNEIEKCDVLCSNCHRRKTAIQFGWYANIDK